MPDSWLNQPASLPELRLSEKLDEEASDAYSRDLMFSEALKALVDRVDALSAQVAEVRAAVGLPVEKPPAPAESEEPSPGWDS